MNPQSVIIVATDVPGLTGGAAARNYHLIRQLVRAGRNVTLVCLSDQATPALTSQLETELKIRAVVVPRPKGHPAVSLVRTLIKRLPPYYLQSRQSGLCQAVLTVAATEPPAVIQLEELEAYYAIMPILPALRQRGTRVILDAHNIEWYAFAQTLGSFSFLKRLIGTYITPALRRLEVKASQASDAILVCSTVDEAFFKPLNQRVSVVPNGVDVAHFANHSQAPADSSQFLFMGSASYPPNADAIQWYLGTIHPLVKATLPNATLTLLCGKPPAWLKAQASHDASIKLPGFVADVRTYIHDASICICPIRIGSGTRLKILEYMGAGKAIVSTTKGAEGIGYQDGRDLRVADDPQSFADALIELAANDTTRYKLGQAAQTLARSTYDWNVIGKHLIRDVYDQLAHEANAS